MSDGPFAEPVHVSHGIGVGRHDIKACLGHTHMNLGHEAGDKKCYWNGSLQFHTINGGWSEIQAPFYARYSRLVINPYWLSVIYYAWLIN